jgi:predicted RNase H-like nuclease (RuvC/YqgF family)
MKISTTLEYTIENSERSDQLIKEQTKALYEITEKHGQTLNEISSNMKLQTQTIERLNTKLDETNESLNHKIDSTDAKVAEIDKKLNSEKSEDAERWSIHFSEIFKFVFWAVLGGAVAVLIPKLFAALAS